MAALSRLLQRARVLGSSEPEHYVFPSCEHATKTNNPSEVRSLDPTRPQKSRRTAWRKLVLEAARRAGREAASDALMAGLGLRQVIAAWKRAAAPYRGFRFHDLRHQAITELAEVGASDATLMAVAGHMSRTMLEHYSHVRMTAKRAALDKLESGLMDSLSVESQPAVQKVNERLRHNPRHKHPSKSRGSLQLTDLYGGRSRARTADLLLVRRYWSLA